MGITERGGLRSVKGACGKVQRVVLSIEVMSERYASPVDDPDRVCSCEVEVIQFD